MAKKFKYAVKYPNFPVIETLYGNSAARADGDEVKANYASGKYTINASGTYNFVVHGKHAAAETEIPAYLVTADMKLV